jgi:hypothetical protein
MAGSVQEDGVEATPLPRPQLVETRRQTRRPRGSREHAAEGGAAREDLLPERRARPEAEVAVTLAGQESFTFEGCGKQSYGLARPTGEITCVLSEL